ncbi:MULTISPECIES: phage N-6-adenine-methyltransferase [Gammaproteobacteria]|uniref:phage N-6-adenine-methyltransferase n=1 Tax=Gammaproteobacteria TaxID=1236 RepID=UPI002FC82F60
MKDIEDKVTGDAFGQVAHPLGLIPGNGYYSAVRPDKFYQVTGHRYNGSKTPDIVRDKWATDKGVIEYMEEQYGKYDLDAAASQENAVCEKYYDERINCLNRWWGSNKHVWLNPPYSHPDPFVKKAIEQMEHNNQIDILLPGDNSTAWFAEARKNAAEIIWIEGDIEIRDGVEYSRTGRLSFISGLTGKPVDGNNKGSVIFVMRKLKEGESQETRYVSITDICPSSLRKKAKKRSV